MELQIIYHKRTGDKAKGLYVIMHFVGEFVERKTEKYMCTGEIAIARKIYWQ